MEHDRRSVADGLTFVIREINESETLQDTLDAIVNATRTSIPEFEHVSLSLRDADGTIETRSGTDQLVWELDTLQYDLMEGPCVQAIEHQPVVVVEHIRHEQRWPRYIPEAARKGVRSQVGVQLFAKGAHLGGLNLYSTKSDEVDESAVDVARLLAAHAAIMLGHAQQEHHLNQALATRKLIGQAVGILMERFEIDEDRAFQFLVRASSTSNIKLRTVAEELVDAANEQFRARATGQQP